MASEVPGSIFDSVSDGVIKPLASIDPCEPGLVLILTTFCKAFLLLVLVKVSVFFRQDRLYDALNSL